MKRYLHGALLLLLGFSLGMHWAGLQVVAWTSMLVERIPVVGLEVAFKTTFDGQHPCRLCLVVRKGQSEDTSAPATFKTVRMDLVLSPEPLDFRAQRAAPSFIPAPWPPMPLRMASPGVPPPKSEA